MKKRKHRATSKEAHESVKIHKQRMYDKIMEALIKMQVGGTSEEIAKVSNMEHSQVWKRLSEMENVYDVGITRMGSKGRRMMVWQLKGLRPPAEFPRTTNEAFHYKQLSLL